MTPRKRNTQTADNPQSVRRSILGKLVESGALAFIAALASVTSEVSFGARFALKPAFQYAYQLLSERWIAAALGAILLGISTFTIGFAVRRRGRVTTLTKEVTQAYQEALKKGFPDTDLGVNSRA